MQRVLELAIPVVRLSLYSSASGTQTTDVNRFIRDSPILRQGRQPVATMGGSLLPIRIFQTRLLRTLMHRHTPRLVLATLFATALLTASTPALAQRGRLFGGPGHGLIDPFAPPHFDGPVVSPESPNNADLRKADEAYRAGKYDEVITLAGSVISRDEKSHVAWHLRGSARIEIGRNLKDKKLVRDGVSDCRQALLLQGNREPVLYLPYLYGMTTLSELENRGDHASSAVKVAGTVLARTDLKDADRAYILYQRGLALAIQGQNDRAIRDFREATKLSPSFLSAYIKLAASQIANNNLKGALEAYDAAAVQAPDSPLLINERGNVRRQLGDLDGAIADFTTCIDLDNTFWMGFVNRGICHLDQNHPDLASNDFSSAIELNPEFALAYRLRGQAAMYQGRFSEAIADYNVAIARNPDDLIAWDHRAYTRYLAGDFAAAADDFEAVRKKAPQAPRQLAWEYLSLIRAGRIDAAQALATDHLTPAAGRGDWTARVCAFLIGTITSEQLIGVAHASDTTTRTPRLCEAHWYIGQKLLADGNKSAAQAHFTQAVGTGMFSLAAYRGSQAELGQIPAKEAK
jgi:tetratricopeptide (TPR) repeat protein